MSAQGVTGATPAQDVVAVADGEVQPSIREAAFDRHRGVAGLLLAPPLFVAVWWLAQDLDPPAQRMAAVLASVMLLWMTEAIPLAMTALLGPALAVILQVAPARQAFAPFADPLVFLVLGGFILAQAMIVHGVDRRFAYSALAIPVVGTSCFRILVAYGAVCAGISMWVSNTATTAMMFPIGLSIARHLEHAGQLSPTNARQFAGAMMLMTAFAASIGGITTPVGTGTNIIGIGMLRQLGGIEVTFSRWVMMGLPIALLLLALLLLQFFLASVKGLSMSRTATEFLQKQLEDLGRVSPGERNVLVAFGVTVTLWSLPGAFAILGVADSPFARWYAAALPEGVAAIFGALLLFIMPVDRRMKTFTLSWQQAARIDWGVLLLFGGGLAVGELVFQTGLAQTIGEGMTTWLPDRTTATLTVMFTAVAIIMSETASNTAAANMIVPIAIAVSQAAGVRPLEPALGATFGASMGFMMPISTPPNAIVYASGFVGIGQMMRHGVLVDIAALIVIVAAVLTLCPLVF